MSIARLHRARAGRVAVIVVLALIFALVPPLGGLRVLSFPRVQVDTIPGFPSTDGQVEPTEEHAHTPGGGQTGPAGEHAPRGNVRSEAVQAPRAFSMVGFTVPQGVEHVRVRTSWDGENWDAWIEAHPREADEGPDPGTAEATQATERTTHPVWVRRARYLQIEVPERSPEEVEATIIDAAGLNGGPVETRIVEQAGAHAADLDVVSRAEWGAAAYKGSPDYAGGVHMLIVHHTVTSNNYSQSEARDIVRGIQAYHQDGNGWDDIGYNMLVDRFGNVYEGRAGGLRRAVIGAHAAGWNSGSSGVAMLGTHSTTNPTQAALSGLVDALAWKAGLHEINPEGTTTRVGDGSRKPTVAGHRDVGSTACPGGEMYDELGWIRSAAADKLPPDHLTALSESVSWVPGDGDFLVRGLGDVDWFWRGEDGQLKQRLHRDEAWLSKTHDLAGTLDAAPSAASWGSDRLDVVVRGTQDRLYHRWWQSGEGWQRWVRLAGRTRSAPAVVSWGHRRLDLFWRGRNGDLQHSWYQRGRWGGPESLGGEVVGVPAAVSWQAGRLDVLVQGTNNRLFHKWWDGSGWRGFRRVTGRIASDPDAVSWGPRRIDVFARGRGDGLFHAWYAEGGWYGPESLGGTLVGMPRAVTWERSQLDAVVPGTGERLYHRWWSDYTWHSFIAFEP